ncbi:T9SS type A sorting domain-containing protein [Hymenobacter sp. J193]|uniref:T9SS type A sorting domain-containing protein n=1 Tax=Hymenobacter sp. J193 TaxID=2898429 RepID=UPI002150CEB3|nr:T9SS type A sorting domain-containing protein [Hymenobacter sp. J193]MCR5886914.1 T9SS type A sorting domain-containing protein [Hymenobacter sp. J193]
MKQTVLALLLFGVGVAQAQAQVPASYLPPVPSRQAGLPAAKLSGQVLGTALTDPNVNHMEYTWDGAKGTWALPPAKIQVERDAKDRITRITNIDSLTGAPRVRNIYTHDFEGVPGQVEVISQWVEDGQWMNYSRHQITPNPKATGGFYYAHSESSEYWKNGAWEPWFKIASTLDEHSNPVAVDVTLWENGTIIKLENWSVQYTYDASNRVTEMVSKCLLGKEKALYQEEKIRYTYTGAATSYTDRTAYNTYHSSGVVTSETTYQAHQEMDAQGRPVLAEVRDWDKATQSWIVRNRTVHSYSTGTTTREHQERKDGSLVDVIRFVTKTDDKGDVAERMVYTPAGTGWKLVNGSYRYVRRYNAQNQLVQEVTQTNTEQAPEVFTNATMNTYMLGTALAAAPPKKLNATIALYPNPTGANASLQLTGLRGTEPVQVEVFNSVGQLMQRHRIAPAGGVGTCLLPVQQLRSGVYTVRLSTSAGTSMQRLVRQ